MTALRHCIEPGCPQLTERTRCREHERLFRAQRKARGRTGARGTDAAWRAARALALERDGHRCTSCGTAEELHVHHVNGNPRDHRLANLLTVCQKCHRAAHRTT